MTTFQSSATVRDLRPVLGRSSSPAFSWDDEGTWPAVLRGPLATYLVEPLDGAGNGSVGAA